MNSCTGTPAVLAAMFAPDCASQLYYRIVADELRRSGLIEMKPWANPIFGPGRNSFGVPIRRHVSM
jgi:hypothetical protein